MEYLSGGCELSLGEVMVDSGQDSLAGEDIVRGELRLSIMVETIMESVVVNLVV